jgi:hypothetical protein
MTSQGNEQGFLVSENEVKLLKTLRKITKTYPTDIGGIGMNAKDLLIICNGSHSPSMVEL